MAVWLNACLKPARDAGQIPGGESDNNGKPGAP